MKSFQAWVLYIVFDAPIQMYFIFNSKRKEQAINIIIKIYIQKAFLVFLWSIL